MIKVVAFDLDDTLYPVKPVLVRAERALDAWLAERLPEVPDTMADMREKHGREVLAAHPQLGHRLTSLRTRVLETGLARSGMAAEEARAHAAEAMEVFLAARNQVDFFDGALEALAALAPRYRLGALSNGNADITRLGLGGHFSFAFSAEDMERAKPAPDLFHAALAHTGVAPAEMAYVGDNPVHDIDGAKQVGLRTLWLKNDRPPGQTVPDKTLASIAELPAALEELERR